MNDEKSPTPAPTEDARWLSPEFRAAWGNSKPDASANCLLQHAQLMDERLQQSESDTKRWRQALESLTPGGSEFFNDPVACAKFVLDRTHWRRMNEAEAQIAAKDRQWLIESLLSLDLYEASTAGEREAAEEQYRRYHDFGIEPEISEDWVPHIKPNPEVAELRRKIAGARVCHSHKSIKPDDCDVCDEHGIVWPPEPAEQVAAPVADEGEYFAQMDIERDRSRRDKESTDAH